jgi:hypothetical protein
MSHKGRFHKSLGLGRVSAPPSGAIDEKWRLIEGLILVCPGGRPRKANLRVDATLYVLRTGYPVALVAQGLPAQVHR